VVMVGLGAGVAYLGWLAGSGRAWPQPEAGTAHR
jgi:hypothetical protein